MDPNCATSPWWGELLKAIPSIVTATTAIVGLWIAKAGLDKWQRETLGKRKAELAEQVLISFYEARDVFKWVRSRGILGGEGQSRKSAEDEDEELRSRRNTYFIPIERLTREKKLFAKLQAQRYAFSAYFGAKATEPFDTLSQSHTSIISAASVLIEAVKFGPGAVPPDDLLNDLGWGRRERPDAIDEAIDSAVVQIENLCKPILEGRGL
ncbi:MAG: hypothetical protein IH605_01005 [Burkholderiales bacterium]|nr:hypothetical protein [Burkholderiales bacterium]